MIVYSEHKLCLFLKFTYFYLFDREREREIPPNWFTPQMLIPAGTGPGQSQEPGTPSEFPM